ncbi:MAG: MMPL family transporter, partial [Myxococcales bacterium]|nr:MMPL family transporter [Myxococcales bacterium]
IALSVIGILRIAVGVDPVSFFPKDHELREVDALFNRRFNGANYLQVMIQGPTPGSVHEPEFIERVASLQKFAEGLPDVRSTVSLVQVLRRFQEVLLGPGAADLPTTREAIAQYLLLYSLGRDTMEDLVDLEDRSVNVTLRIPHTDNQRHEKVFRAIDRFVRTTFPPEYQVHYGGTLMLFVAMTHYVVVGKIINIICSWLIVVAFCALIYRSISRGVLTVVPPAFGTIFTFGMMGFLGIRLDPATAILTSIAVGIGVDFAIHVVARLIVEVRKDGEIEAAAVRTLQTAGRGVLLDVFSNVLGFSAVIFSRFVPIQNFGYLVVLAMVTTAFATLLLLVPLADTFRPKFLFAPVPAREDRDSSNERESARRAA